MANCRMTFPVDKTILRVTLAVVFVGCNSGREASFRPERLDDIALVRATDDNFQTTVLDRDRPVFVEFWSARCVPCLEMRATIKQLVAEFDNEVIFAELNVDANPGTAKRLGISTLPVCLIFDHGEPAEKLEGLRTRDEIADALRRVLRD
jgi:thioredoxin 1